MSTSDIPLRTLTTALSTAAALTAVSCTPWQSAAWDTARFLARPDATELASAADRVPLRPDLRYLRVTTNGLTALLVLGDIDHDGAGRPVQVWYSASGEVIRLQDGRLVGLTGTPVEWRDVKLPATLPPWADVKAPSTYKRQRDEMPGYRIGLQEQVMLQPIEAPPNSGLRNIPAASLQWFEETAAPNPDTPATLAAHQPVAAPTRYAMRRTDQGLEPVYGEQCIAPTMCIQWQIWPPRPSEN